MYENLFPSSEGLERCRCPMLRMIQHYVTRRWAVTHYLRSKSRIPAWGARRRVGIAGGPEELALQRDSFIQFTSLARGLIASRGSQPSPRGMTTLVGDSRLTFIPRARRQCAESRRGADNRRAINRKIVQQSNNPTPSLVYVRLCSPLCVRFYECLAANR